jgi:hypothetical protein
VTCETRFWNVCPRAVMETSECTEVISC